MNYPQNARWFVSFGAVWSEKKQRLTLKQCEQQYCWWQTTHCFKIRFTLKSWLLKYYHKKNCYILCTFKSFLVYLKFVITIFFIRKYVVCSSTSKQSNFFLHSSLLIKTHLIFYMDNSEQNILDDSKSSKSLSHVQHTGFTACIIRSIKSNVTVIQCEPQHWSGTLLWQYTALIYFMQQCGLFLCEDMGCNLSASSFLIQASLR